MGRSPVRNPRCLRNRTRVKAEGKGEQQHSHAGGRTSSCQLRKAMLAALRLGRVRTGQQINDEKPDALEGVRWGFKSASGEKQKMSLQGVSASPATAPLPCIVPQPGGQQPTRPLWDSETGPRGTLSPVGTRFSTFVQRRASL